MFPLLYIISTFILTLVTLLTGERLSIHTSICKVRHLTFFCLTSLPSCTVEQLKWPACVQREGYLQYLPLGYQRWVPFGTYILLFLVIYSCIRCLGQPEGDIMNCHICPLPPQWPKLIAPKLWPGVRGQEGLQPSTYLCFPCLAVK